MSIRLQGGTETSGYWQRVRGVGPEILENAGLGNWKVTIQPLTAQMMERADISPSDTEDIAVTVCEKRAEMILGVPLGEIEDTVDPAVFVKHHIVELIDQLVR